jgi:hypothetical protein
MAPGSGGLKVGLLAQSEIKKTFLGVGLEYEHRINQNLSAFSQVSLGAQNIGKTWAPNLSATAGLQLKF